MRFKVALRNGPPSPEQNGQCDYCVFYAQKTIPVKYFNKSAASSPVSGA